MKQIIVTRIGFTGVGDEEYDGPEKGIESVLRRAEAHGHQIVSVSVLRSTRGTERYEAFVVSRVEA